MTEPLLGIERLFLALGDKTRLRILNLMRDSEVSVGLFAEILGESQPKISRHLAYLRNMGIVETRRDGKWIHYSISGRNAADGGQIMNALCEWFDGDEMLERDCNRHRQLARAFGNVYDSRIDSVINTSERANMYEHQDSNNYDSDELEDFLL